MLVEAKQAFYNEETGAVQPWRDIEVTDTVGEGLIGEGLAVAIAEGGGGGGVVIVTSTMDEDFTVTLSKTYAELADSLSNGVPVFWVSSNPYGYSMYPLLLCENNEGCVVTFMGTEGAVTFSCASENDYPYQED